MSEIKTIKGVDDETWARFKSLAASNNMRMGNFFKILVNDFDRSNRSFWDKILSKKRTLTDKEADDIMEACKKVRSEYGFRI